jgi:predicted dehydrogenase
MPKADMTNRRTFLKRSSTAAAGLVFYGAAARFTRAEAPSSRMRIAVMGCGRGLAHISSALDIPNTELVALCDVDKDRLAAGQKTASQKQKKEFKAETDIRRVLEEKDLDALFIAAPNHWHAPATILACTAGKHVYVEKPCSHNPWEGEMMVMAARKYNRKVQMGNQRRTWPAVVEGIEKMRAGAIGKLRYSRCWYVSARGSIERGKAVPVPDRLDYSLWQGPAPERPYKDNFVPYNWHWFWHWGNGELGNNGVHGLDLARWGLDVRCPKRVTCTGGRYHFDDDQETPDTAMASYDFGEVGISWDCSSCLPRTNEKLPFVSFYGDQGTLENHGGGYKIFDLKGKLVEEKNGPGGEKGHIENFFDAIRENKPLNSEIQEGHWSTLLCHLGNIAYRTGHELHTDSENGHILKDSEAMKLWKREYRRGWEPKV